MPTVNGENVDVGCYVDGHHGQYDVDAVCRIASDLLGKESFVIECSVYRTRLDDPDTDDTMDPGQALSELADEATEALNEATTGGHWEWVDGELFLSLPEVDEDDFAYFVSGYIEAMLWADCMPTEAEVDANDCWESGGKTHLEVSDATRREIVEKGQLREFVTENYDDLLEYVETRVETISEGTPWEHAGHDHLLTRGHHGVGFWDRGLGALGDRLTEASQAYGSTDDHLLWDAGDGTAVCS